jgi:hypothetical protein
MPQVKLTGPSMEDRIDARLQNSGIGRGTMPDKSITKGSGPTRTHTNLHHSSGVSTPPNNRGRARDDGWRR